MEGLQNLRRPPSPIIRIVLSLACAGITYFVWMGTFILLANSTGPIMKGVLWITAPIATAMGFALGMFIHEHKSGIRKATFLSVFVWPLLGCAVGAIVIFWRGPMLIVFGMFIVGTASVVLREVIFHTKERHNQSNA